MMNFKKLIKENTGFIISLVVMGFILFNPPVRAFFTRQILKTGLFSPKISDNAEELKQDLLLKDINGKLISLKELEGKVVFINFWATWCPPCIAEMPSIQKLYDETQGLNVVFAMVDVDNDQDKALKFLEKGNFTLPLYHPSSSISDQLFEGSLPTTIVLNKKGQIVLKQQGMSDYADKKFIDKIKSLVTE